MKKIYKVAAVFLLALVPVTSQATVVKELKKPVIVQHRKFTPAEIQREKTAAAHHLANGKRFKKQQDFAHLNQ